MRTVAGQAWVRVGGQSGCPACDAGQGCGAGIFARLMNRRPVDIEVPNDLGASPGATVTLGITERLYLALVWRLYGIPLLAGLLGGMLAWQAWAATMPEGLLPDLVTLAGGLAGAMLAYRLSARRLRSRAANLPLRLIESGGMRDNCKGAMQAGDTSV